MWAFTGRRLLYTGYFLVVAQVVPWVWTTFNFAGLFTAAIVLNGLGALAVLPIRSVR